MNEIEAARRQALARIEAAGYRLGGGLAEDAFPARELYLDAWLANARVGTAHFSDHGAYAFCQNIEIAPDHQCKGLESAMYVLAEQMLDQTLKNIKSTRTRRVIRLRANANRPRLGPLRSPQLLRYEGSIVTGSCWSWGRFELGVG